MICPKCNVENANNNYCYNCGASLCNLKKSSYKDISLILGIICLFSSFILNIICIIPGIISIVYAVKHKKESGKLGVGFGLSLAGIIFSILVWVVAILLLILVSYVPSNIDDDYYENSYENEYVYNLSKTNYSI